MHTVKTAISIEDDLLQQADRMAGEMGLSRSRLFSLALKDYLRRHKLEEMMSQLNLVYGKERDSPERRVARKMKAKFHQTIKERW